MESKDSVVVRYVACVRVPQKIDLYYDILTKIMYLMVTYNGWIHIRHDGAGTTTYYYHFCSHGNCQMFCDGVIDVSQDVQVELQHLYERVKDAIVTVES